MDSAILQLETVWKEKTIEQTSQEMEEQDLQFLEGHWAAQVRHWKWHAEAFTKRQDMTAA